MVLWVLFRVPTTTHFSRQGFPRKPTFRTSRSSAPAGLSAQADLLRRQDFPCKPNLPRKPDFPRNSPSSPGAPRIALLDSGKPPSRPSLVFPLLYPRTRPPHHPARAGIPNYSEGVITPSPGHPETSASPTWASAAVTGAFHTLLTVLLRLRRTLPNSADLPPGLYVTTMVPSTSVTIVGQ